MKVVYACTALALLQSAVSGASDKDKQLKTCTIRSPTTGAFFDLSRMSIPRPEPGKKPDKEDAIIGSWHARGYDYPANFTLNICAAVVEELHDVVGVDKALWRNVSAFYEMNGKKYSIGQQNAEPVFRGRKLVLNYTNGSPCHLKSRTRSMPLGVREELSSKAFSDEDEDDEKKPTKGGNKHGDSDDEKEPNKGGKKHDHDDDGKEPKKGDGKDGEDNDHDKEPKKGGTKHGHDDDEKEPNRGGDKHGNEDEKEPNNGGKHEGNVRKKSTIMSFLCEKDGKGAVSFVGADEDECTYFFEARSAAACPGFETQKQQLGPGGVFSVIAIIAVLVYIGGGCVYQRTVMHQRGWRQLPNYSFWAAIGGFFRDIFIILTSSCSRFLPKRRGYSRVSTTANGRVRGSRDDENRLIDQLDEEWDE